MPLVFNRLGLKMLLVKNYVRPPVLLIFRAKLKSLI